MKILYIFRAIKGGPSIRRVFEPVAEYLSETNEVESIFLPYEGASLNTIRKNIWFVKNHLKANSYDVIHVTGDVYYLLWGLRKYNVVVTVHDLLFYSRISNPIKKKLMYILELYPLRFAKAITFISEASRDEAFRFLSIQNENTAVIYNPVNPSFIPYRKELNKDCPTILHLGTKPNKNLPRVLEAIKDINCKLHIIGTISSDIMQKIETYKIKAKVDMNLSDEQILEAYKDCDIVSFPSLYEGFGMPIIEGQMISRIVVISDIEPMKSVSGGAAIMVDPYDVASIRKGMISAMDAKTTLIEEGLNNAKKFSVESISLKYYNLYRTTM